MKKINLNVNYEIDKEKNPEAQDNVQITVNYFLFAVRLAYEKGISSDKRRLFVTIKEKLDAAVKNKTDVELNDFEFMFLRDAFSRAVAPVSEALFLTKAEGALLVAAGEDPVGEATEKTAKNK